MIVSTIRRLGRAFLPWCFAGSLGAQQIVVHGVVIDSVTRSPLPGVVVTALRDDGRVLARTISALDGAFRFPKPDTAFRLRVLRIGYEPLDLMGTGDRDLRIAMNHLPLSLATMRVSGQSACPNSKSSGEAFGFWEQARAGLLAAVVAREANPATATIVTYDRRESVGDSLVTSQVLRTTTGATRRPFFSPNPAILEQRGYVVEESDGRRFYVPDADVLLDESFAAAHCFRLKDADAEHPSAIGVEFFPARGGGSVPNVAGTIWLDRQTPALRSVEFHYTGLEESARSAGGVIEFHTPQNGATFVTRWVASFPILKLRDARAASLDNGRLTRSSVREFDVAEVQTSGGIVEAARWKDGSVWASPTTTVQGTVIERTTNRPVPFAIVSLAGTADSAIADSLGKFSLPLLVPGRYRLVAADTALAGIYRDRTDTRVLRATAGSKIAVSPELPALTESIAQFCGPPKTNQDVAMLFGQIRLPAGSSTKSARVNVRWRLTDAALSRTNYRELERDVDVDVRGRFVVCGLPMEERLDLRLSYDRGQADTSITITRNYVRALEWRP